MALTYSTSFYKKPKSRPSSKMCLISKHIIVQNISQKFLNSLTTIVVKMKTTRKNVVFCNNPKGGTTVVGKSKSVEEK